MDNVYNTHEGQDSIICRVTGLQARRCGVRIQAAAKDFSVFRKVQTGSGAHTDYCSVATGAASWTSAAKAWSWGLISMYNWSEEWLELYLPCIPLRHGQGPLYLYVYLQWVTGRTRMDGGIMWCYCQRLCFPGSCNLFCNMKPTLNKISEPSFDRATINTGRNQSSDSCSEQAVAVTGRCATTVWPVPR